MRVWILGETPTKGPLKGGPTGVPPETEQVPQSIDRHKRRGGPQKFILFLRTPTHLPRFGRQETFPDPWVSKKSPAVSLYGRQKDLRVLPTYQTHGEPRKSVSLKQVLSDI